MWHVLKIVGYVFAAIAAVILFWVVAFVRHIEKDGVEQ